MGCWCQSWPHNEATLSLTSDPRRHSSHLDINLDDTLILFTNSYRLEPNAKARAVVSVVRLIPGSGITNCRVVRWDTFFSCHPSSIVLVRPPPMLVWMDVNSLISMTEPTPLFKRALIPEDFRNLSLQMIYFSFFLFKNAQRRKQSRQTTECLMNPRAPTGGTKDWLNAAMNHPSPTSESTFRRRDQGIKPRSRRQVRRRTTVFLRPAERAYQDHDVGRLR